MLTADHRSPAEPWWDRRGRSAPESLKLHVVHQEIPGLDQLVDLLQQFFLLLPVLAGLVIICSTRHRSQLPVVTDYPLDSKYIQRGSVQTTNHGINNWMRSQVVWSCGEYTRYILLGGSSMRRSMPRYCSAADYKLGWSQVNCIHLWQICLTGLYNLYSTWTEKHISTHHRLMN